MNLRINYNKKKTIKKLQELYIITDINCIYTTYSQVVPCPQGLSEHLWQECDLGSSTGKSFMNSICTKVFEFKHVDYHNKVLYILKPILLKPTTKLKYCIIESDGFKIKNE